MQQVEYIFCWSDHTWTTEVWEVPDEIDPTTDDLTDWAQSEADHRNLGGLCYIGIFRRVC